jgi:hypothetical protein
VDGSNYTCVISRQLGKAGCSGQFMFLHSAHRQAGRQAGSFGTAYVTHVCCYVAMVPVVKPGQQDRIGQGSLARVSGSGI